MGRHKTTVKSTSGSLVFVFVAVILILLVKELLNNGSDNSSVKRGRNGNLLCVESLDQANQMTNCRTLTANTNSKTNPPKPSTCPRDMAIIKHALSFCLFLAALT